VVFLSNLRWILELWNGKVITVPFSFKMSPRTFNYLENGCIYKIIPEDLLFILQSWPNKYVLGWMCQVTPRYFSNVIQFWLPPNLTYSPMTYLYLRSLWPTYLCLCSLWPFWGNTLDMGVLCNISEFQGSVRQVCGCFSSVTQMSAKMYRCCSGDN